MGLRKVGGGTGDIELGAAAAAAVEVAYLALEGRGEAKIIKQGRAQSHGEVANHAHGLFGEFLGLLVVGAELVRVGAEAFEGAEFQTEPGEHLADVVVELPGEVAAFVLLGADDAGGEFPELLFGLDPGGFEVTDAPDGAHGDEAADGESEGNQSSAFVAKGLLFTVEGLHLAFAGGGAEAGDLAGDGEEVIAAWTRLRAEKVSASEVFIRGGPGEDGAAEA